MALAIVGTLCFGILLTEREPEPSQTDHLESAQIVPEPAALSTPPVEEAWGSEEPPPDRPLLDPLETPSPQLSVVAQRWRKAILLGHRAAIFQGVFVLRQDPEGKQQLRLLSADADERVRAYAKLELGRQAQLEGKQ